MKNICSLPFDYIKGMVTAPGQTVGQAMKQKRWLGVLLVLLVVVWVYQYLHFPILVEKLYQEPTTSQLIEEGILGAPKDTFLNRLFIGAGGVIFMLLGLIFAAFFLYLFYGVAGIDGTYIHFFSLEVNASIIDVFFPHLIAIIFLAIGVDAYVFSRPLLLIFSPEPQSFSYLILSWVDVFYFWHILVIAAGVHIFSEGKMSLRRSLVISGLFFLFKALVIISFSYLLIRVLGA